MASSQRPQHALSYNAQEKMQEDFEFRDDSLNRECLTSCLTFLCDRMIVDEVIIRLQANKVLTIHEVDLIRGKETRLTKNHILVDFVQQRDPEAFNRFMQSLTETGQKFLSDKIIEERKVIAEREKLSTLAMWSAKLMSAKKKVNLESLITEEELEQLKNIRVKKIPEQIGQIGKGAYGKVLLFKLEDGSFRAGKKPKINLENKSPEEEKQLKKHLSYALGEIKILHQLDHERIIKFYGFYLDQGQMIIFMEAMRGSVRDEINEKGCLSEVTAMNYFIQATEGLVYLHSRRSPIVHRDIKCENLLLTVQYNVKLADFGLAIDQVTDNGSLACTLVQMISGEPPYRNLSLIELIQRSSATSQNPLKYSGDLLLPAASEAIKKLLDSMFIVDYKLRLSADHVLTLAHSVVRTISNGRDIANRLNDDKRQHSFNSLSNGLQNISMNNQRALVEAASAEKVQNVRHLANVYLQHNTFNKGGHGNKMSGIHESIEDSSSGRKGTEQGDAMTQNNLGDAYYYGLGVNQSYEDAMKWYRKAAKQGNADAQYNLGRMYEKGIGMPKSDEESFEWYGKLVGHGKADAQKNLAWMFQNGQAVPKTDQALKWYKKSAEQGNADAQYSLGRMYEKEMDLPQSDEAVKWYRKSAEQGNADAQCNLGRMYERGICLPRSNEEAVKWYRKSAEQGNADGQCSLGWMYQSGTGVPQSDDEAVYWHTKSAEQGNAFAKSCLRGIPRKWRGTLNY